MGGRQQLRLLAHTPVRRPAAVRGAAVLARPAGVPGRLAGLNATRHRSRTAATAAALLIGTTLIAEGFGVHVPKGYIYAAMAFSAGVEALNMLGRSSATKKAKAEAVPAALPVKTRLVYVGHPHNPTGRVWTPEELERLRDLAVKYDLFVMSDELHADLRYEGRAFESFAATLTHRRFFLGSAVRPSWMATEVAERAISAMDLSGKKD
mgnify:CR=1 FL=1